jgi:hypothetical protein
VSDAVVYIASALVGALVGGLASLLVSVRGAHRDRRARYGEALLESLTSLHGEVVSALDLPDTPEVGSAAAQPYSKALTTMWVRAELVGSLERTRANTAAIQSWLEDLVSAVLAAHQSRSNLEDAEERLRAGIYIVIAWTAEIAQGTDFNRPREQIIKTFGPHTKAQA